jgi:TRAP-type mannitol/chloroaromatic compound transport system permease small subunit
MIYDRLTPRKKAFIDSITYIFFMIYMVALLLASGKYAWNSVLVRETSGSAWDPPIYPIKISLPVGAALLLLQGTVKFIRDIHFALKGTRI